MRTHFAEVLARESACLAGVTDGAKLAGWRRRVVRELMTPQSPYVLALRETGDVPDRADFLGRWRGLIAQTVDRLLHSSTPGDTNCSSAQPWRDAVDAQQIAVLILAALHGGGTLSQVAQDPRPLNAALDIALAPLAPPLNAHGDDTGTEGPDSTMST
jgi:hypothetical protein